MTIEALIKHLRKFPKDLHVGLSVHGHTHVPSIPEQKIFGDDLHVIKTEKRHADPEVNHDIVLIWDGSRIRDGYLGDIEK